MYQQSDKRLDQQMCESLGCEPGWPDRDCPIHGFAPVSPVEIVITVRREDGRSSCTVTADSFAEAVEEFEEVIRTWKPA